MKSSKKKLAASFYFLMVNGTWEKAERQIPADVARVFPDEEELAEWVMEGIDLGEFPSITVRVFFDEWVNS